MLTISMSDDEQRQQWQRQIEELLNRRRIARARPLVSSALTAFPDDIELRLLAAWMEVLDEQPSEAAKWCESVLNDQPDSERARYLLACACEDLDDLKQAESLYQSLLFDYPNDADYLAGLSLLLFRTVQHDRAHALAALAMAIDPDNRRAQQAAFFSALTNGDQARVDAIIENVMADDPDSVHNARTLLVALEDRRRYTDALRLARMILLIEPDNPNNVEQVIELSWRAHWSMAPLRWLTDYHQVAIYAGVVGIGLLAWEQAGPTGRTLGAAILAFATYGLLWPPLLKKLITR